MQTIDHGYMVSKFNLTKYCHIIGKIILRSLSWERARGRGPGGGVKHWFYFRRFEVQMQNVAKFFHISKLIFQPKWLFFPESHFRFERNFQHRLSFFFNFLFQFSNGGNFLTVAILFHSKSHESPIYSDAHDAIVWESEVYRMKRNKFPSLGFKS